jgi:hypothetical protein
MWWVVAVVAVVVLVATYLTWTAARVDRLHARAAASLATLDAHLVRRSAAAGALGEAAQIPDLVYAARIALAAGPEDREAAENDLTRHLRGILGGPEDVFGELVAVSRRVALARHVHNDVVRDALAMRRRIWVRAFQLAKKHPRPTYFDVDDPTIAAPVPGSGAVTPDSDAWAAG